MEVKEDIKSKLTKSKVILFGFELSRTQSALLLILSYIGIIYLPLILMEQILFKLFQTLFVDLPFYLSPLYPEYLKTDLWFYEMFAPHVTKIMVTTIFLYLSIYTLKNILNPDEKKRKKKSNIIQHDRIVKWFGFKLSHGQSLFIFIISIIGILLAFQNIIDVSVSQHFGTLQLLIDLCYIPIGPYLVISHEILRNTILILFNIIIILLALYSLFKARTGKTVSTSRNPIRNYALIMYLSILIVILLFFLRLLCHLFLFTDLGHLLGITPGASNSYQTNDFEIVIKILIVSLLLIAPCSLIRETPYDYKTVTNEITWFRISLTPKKAIVLISLAIVFTIFLTYYFLISVFIISIFNFPHPPALIVICLLLSIVVFLYYPIEKILKRGRFTNYVDSIDNSELLVSKWFKFRLSRLYSLLFLSVSYSFVFIHVFYLMAMTLFTHINLLTLENLAFYNLISIPASLVIIGTLFAINLYTIKRTIHSIKSH